MRNPFQDQEAILAMIPLGLLISDYKYGNIVLLFLCLIVFIILILDTRITKSKIKNDLYFKVGIIEHKKQTKLFMFFIGILVIGVGLYNYLDNKSFISNLGFFLLGFLIMIWDFIRINNLLFIIKDNSILFEVERRIYEWGNSKIIEVELKKKHIYFKKKKITFDYDMSEFTDIQITEIKDKIMEKIKDKVIEK